MKFSQLGLSVDDTNQGGFFMKFKVVVQTRTTVFETIIEAVDAARARLIAQQQYPGDNRGMLSGVNPEDLYAYHTVQPSPIGLVFC